MKIHYGGTEEPPSLWISQTSMRLSIQRLIYRGWKRTDNSKGYVRIHFALATFDCIIKWRKMSHIAAKNVSLLGFYFNTLTSNGGQNLLLFYLKTIKFWKFWIMKAEWGLFNFSFSIIVIVFQLFLSAKQLELLFIHHLLILLCARQQVQQYSPPVSYSVSSRTPAWLCRWS